MTDQKLTLSAFRAAGAECLDLGEALGDATWDDDSTRTNGKGIGRLYPGLLYIESTANWLSDERDSGKWCLILERSEFISNDLAELEARLYAFGLQSGAFAVDADSLIELALNAACKAIQDGLGQTDGGVAGAHFTDGSPEHETFRRLFVAYIATEVQYLQSTI